MFVSTQVQVAQLESTLKADLTDKKAVTDMLAKERENYAHLEGEFKDLQSRYFKVKESLEALEEEGGGGPRNTEPLADTREMQEALALLRQQKEKAGLPPSQPSFLEAVDTAKTDKQAELNELQVQHVEAVNELEKTRPLLKAQGNINRELRNEVDALKTRLQQVLHSYLHSDRKQLFISLLIFQQYMSTWWHFSYYTEIINVIFELISIFWLKKPVSIVANTY